MTLLLLAVVGFIAIGFLKVGPVIQAVLVAAVTLGMMATMWFTNNI